jgi:hypothetical protein
VSTDWPENGACREHRSGADCLNGDCRKGGTSASVDETPATVSSCNEGRGADETRGVGLELMSGNDDLPKRELSEGLL